MDTMGGGITAEFQGGALENNGNICLLLLYSFWILVQGEGLQLIIMSYFTDY
jgi:hypothetical protein